MTQEEMVCNVTVALINNGRFSTIEDLVFQAKKIVGLIREEEVFMGLNASDFLGLSIRTTRCLKNAEINTMKELLASSLEDLRRIRNFGLRSYEEINARLAQKGLWLNDSKIEEFTR